ncbi:hypothetical protein H6B10_16995, partial [Gemmiger formicilis]
VEDGLLVLLHVLVVGQGDALHHHQQGVQIAVDPAGLAADKTLEELTLDEFKQYSDLFEEDVYHAIDLTTCCEG